MGIAEKRCKVLQARLKEELNCQRDIAGHMRVTIEAMEKAEEDRESVDEPYWSVAAGASSSPSTYQFPMPAPGPPSSQRSDFPELSHYSPQAPTGLSRSSSVKDAKYL